MRSVLLVGALISLGCEGPPVEPCRPAAPSHRSELGVAHVAGAYQPPSDLPFLLAGANDVSRVGLRTLKAYLTPEYRTKYPQPGWPAVTSLTELAKTQQFRALFDGPFDTFVLTTYTFSNGVGDPWRTSDADSLYDAEADELEALATHLLRTYAGTGKTFVLQNWEGDWALLAGAAPSTRVDPARIARMRRWLEARQAGVARARAFVGTEGVDVRHAAEVNLVASADGSRVLDDVLPGLCVDAVSYSAWDSLAVDVSLPLVEQRERVARALDRAVARLRAVAQSAELFFGEVGFAEQEHPTGHAAALLDEVLLASERHGMSRTIYWQVYDNECVGDACRGLWLVKPDGAFSEVGEALRHSSLAVR